MSNDAIYFKLLSISLSHFVRSLSTVFVAACVCSTPICVIEPSSLGQFGIYNLTVNQTGCSFQTHRAPVNGNWCKYSTCTHLLVGIIIIRIRIITPQYHVCHCEPTNIFEHSLNMNDVVWTFFVSVFNTIHQFQSHRNKSFLSYVIAAVFIVSFCLIVCLFIFFCAQLYSGHWYSFYCYISSSNYWSEVNSILSDVLRVQPQRVSLIMMLSHQRHQCRTHKWQPPQWLRRKKFQPACAAWMLFVAWQLWRWFLQMPDVENTIGLSMPRGMAFIRLILYFHRFYGLWAFVYPLPSNHNSIKTFRAKTFLGIFSLWVL